MLKCACLRRRSRSESIAPAHRARRPARLACGTTEAADLLASGPLVMSFFCMMGLEALQAVLPQIRELGAWLVAISPQRPSYGFSPPWACVLLFLAWDSCLKSSHHVLPAGRCHHRVGP